ncbi:MAG: NHL repeat-containing protein [Pirellulales bacterium]
MTFDYVQTISGKGPRRDQFQKALRAVGVDRAGQIYAVGDQEIKAFAPLGEGARLRGRWPTAMAGRSIAIDGKNQVYVGETGQVEIFDADGKLLRRLSDKERLGRVTAVAISTDELLVADASHRCIRRYNTDGKWLGDIGADNNTHGFLIPNGRLDFCTDPTGIVHAVNPSKHRVERYGLNGKLIGHFGRFGPRVEDFPGCCNPLNIARSAGGVLVVAEKAPPRIKAYNDQGKLLAAGGTDRLDPNCKNLDLAIDPQGTLYVTDTVRLQVVVFRCHALSEPATGQAVTADLEGTRS